MDDRDTLINLEDVEQILQDPQKLFPSESIDGYKSNLRDLRDRCDQCGGLDHYVRMLNTKLGEVEERGSDFD